MVEQASSDTEKEILIWEVFEENYTNPSSESVYAYTQGIRREDGFTLLCHRMDREYFQTYVCRCSFGEFKFYARRWQGKPLDMYTVHVDMNPDRDYTDKSAHRKLVLEHAKNIEA